MPSLGFATLPLPAGNPNARTNTNTRVLTNEQAAQLQMDYRQPGVSTRALGEKYGVSQQTAHRIATGKHYAELPTAPVVAKLNWVDPPVARRGLPSEVDIKRLIVALKSNIGHWALIKKTVRKPQISHWLSHGIETETRKLPSGDYGVYVRWPADQEALLAS